MALAICGWGIIFLRISWNSVRCWMTFILLSQAVCSLSVKGTALLYHLDVKRDYFARGHGRVREVMIKLYPLEYAAGWRCGEWYLHSSSFPFFADDSEQKWPGSFYVRKDSGLIWNKRRKASHCFKCIVVQLNESPVLPTHDLIISAAMHSPFL